ncbi:hypothetical protein SPX-Pendick_021 [Sheeppox virus]|uniref:Uncharacterized protein n=1 Tax=Sheeppox virus TaxID=10266 RepID=A0A5C0PV19_SHEV|nr:hypothetical protein SPX-Pendick_021 [Sheeppox virus]
MYNNNAFSIGTVIFLIVLIIVIVISLYLLFQLVNCFYLFKFLNKVKVKMMNITTKISFDELENVYYIDDTYTCVGVNVD